MARGAQSKAPAGAGSRKSRPARPGATHRFRIRLVFAALLAGFGLIAYHLCTIQLSPDAKLSEDDERHIARAMIQVPRGSIYDANGRLLATDRQSPSLWVNPSRVEKPEALARELSTRLGLEYADVRERLTRRADSGAPMKFVWLKRRLNPDEYERVADLIEAGTPGLSVRKEPTRYYPEGPLGAHVLGFVNDERKGSAGVELVFDRYLRSTPGQRVARADRQRVLLESLTLEYTEPEGGDHLYLTLDATIQYRLEEELKAAVEATGGSNGMALLMDPRTGAILAMACVPSYNPNRFRETPLELVRNRAAVDTFEPGSAFKVVTAAAALELGLMTPETPIDCEGGQWAIGRRRITDTHEEDVVPFRRAFAESSNIAIIKIAQMLGERRLEEWILRFGFGRTTCDDLPAESPGQFRRLANWSGYSLASLAMGQEIAVTMLQLARAYSAIANGGNLVEPHLVEYSVGRAGGIHYAREASPGVRILSHRTAAQLRDMCHEVVMDGTGWRASIDEYRVGGKTGTAQMARKDGRGYDDKRYSAVFAGFAPVKDPRVVAVVVIQEPKIGKHHGGFASAPVFREVVRDALVRMQVAADPVARPAEEKPAGAGDADTVGPRMEAVLADVDVDSLLASIDTLNPLLLEEGAGADVAVLPDLYGLTKSEVMRRLAELGVGWDPQGSGWVVDQDPPPGTPLRAVSLCRVVFRNRTSETNDQTALAAADAGG